MTTVSESSMVSGSITGILYNRQLMTYAGEDGVAAYCVVMYVAFVFVGVFMGYSQGCSPIMGYHYGAQNHPETKNILKRSIILLAASAVVLTALAILLARPLSAVFIGYDPELLDLTVHAFVICAVPFKIKIIPPFGVLPRHYLLPFQKSCYHLK